MDTLSCTTIRGIGKKRDTETGKLRNMLRSQRRMGVFTLCEFIKTCLSIPVLPRSVRGVLIFFVLACPCPAHVSGVSSAVTDDYAREIRELAQAGDAEGQFALAQILDLGSRPVQNREEAVLWLRKAADQGLAAACFTLGLKYEFGTTLQKDLKQAAAWYRRAALQDLPMAQYRLGLLHLPDDGQNRNRSRPLPGCRWPPNTAILKPPRCGTERPDS